MEIRRHTQYAPFVTLLAVVACLGAAAEVWAFSGIYEAAESGEGVRSSAAVCTDGVRMGWSRPLLAEESLASGQGCPPRE